MLLAFRVANHKSIRDEIELSLVRSLRMAARSARDRPGPDLPSPVAAVYGSNASGKSNLVDAIAFMSSAVRDSYGRWPPERPIPVSPFALDEEHARGPSTFEVDVVLDGTRYQYGFALGFERVEEEWLYAYPHRRRQIWFERDSSAREEFRFGENLAGRKQTLAELTKPTSLFLSVAGSSNHPQLTPVATWFMTALEVARPSNETSRLVSTMLAVRRDEALCGQLTGLLRFADLGVCGIQVERADADVAVDWANVDLGKLLVVLGEHVGAMETAVDPVESDDLEWTVELVHDAPGERRVALPFAHESRGTKALIALGGPTLRALQRGGTLVVDELDTSMHPRLVAEIVRLFQAPHTNPRNAQLIFTSHDTSLMDSLSEESPLLERDQVWLTEKDLGGVTRLYPLTDFSPRKLENLERGYRQGRYGAVPFFERHRLESTLAEGQ